MAFDFKKECKELYKSASKPSIVTIPPFNLRAGFSRDSVSTNGIIRQPICKAVYIVSVCLTK